MLLHVLHLTIEVTQHINACECCNKHGGDAYIRMDVTWQSGTGVAHSMTHSMTGVLVPHFIEYSHRSMYRIDDGVKSNENRMVIEWIDYRAINRMKIE